MPCASCTGTSHGAAPGQSNPVHNPSHTRGTTGHRGYSPAHLKGPLGVMPRCGKGMSRNNQGHCVPTPKLPGQR